MIALVCLRPLYCVCACVSEDESDGSPCGVADHPANGDASETSMALKIPNMFVFRLHE